MPRSPRPSKNDGLPFYEALKKSRPAHPAEPEKKAWTPPCGIYKKCGGCQMQNLPYIDQLRWKQSQLQKMLGRYGRLPFILGMDDPTHYRNKMQVAFGCTRGGKTVSGVWQAKERRIAVTDSCMLEDPAAAKIAATVRRLLPAFKLTPYDAASDRGFFRHLLVRKAEGTGELMVVLVGASPAFPHKANFAKALLKAHPEITTLVYAVNDSDIELTITGHEETLFGRGYIEDRLCGLVFRISPRSFYQVNAKGAALLYNKAMGFADLQGGERVIDAYCGIGTIGLIAAGQAGEVLGIENNPAAVRDAQQNAKLNQISNIHFVCADAGDYLQKFADDGGSADLLLMDPPRAGSSRKFLEAAIKLSPEKIVYISCNPETLARDLQALVRGGYQVKKMQPVDMFPWTHHIECAVLLQKKGKAPYA
ncbi:MAG: 23S rRNA (uracil(1939)-C(5))-methyltransferase RlmD [Oscillospiraceae bacterium]|jgi:23S rRNA (uracil1939-C5)-methyltransferase|nr:23S rRNA (uracil(1939)-C(5))-methyltransferase RlmD [Oscillospiraceae bacterium]